MKALLLGEPNQWVRRSDTEKSADGSLVPSQFMRSISFCLLMRRVEFCRELRLEAAAGLFELSFSPRYVSQQCVQLLRTQYQQSEHKYEQDFGIQTHCSPLGGPLRGRNGGCGAGRFLLVSFHAARKAFVRPASSYVKRTQ